MVSTWEPLITVRDDADRQRVAPIIAALKAKRGEGHVRSVDHEAWRVDMGLDSTDNPATARQALTRLLHSIDKKRDEVLQIEEEPED
jgi:hypothetical protein